MGKKTYASQVLPASSRLVRPISTTFFTTRPTQRSGSKTAPLINPKSIARTKLVQPQSPKMGLGLRSRLISKTTSIKKPRTPSNLIGISPTIFSGGGFGGELGIGGFYVPPFKPQLKSSTGKKAQRAKQPTQYQTSLTGSVFKIKGRPSKLLGGYSPFRIRGK